MLLSFLTATIFFFLRLGKFLLLLFGVFNTEPVVTVEGSVLLNTAYLSVFWGNTGEEI